MNGSMGGATLITIAVIVWIAVISIFTYAGMWKTFEKAGVKGIFAIFPLVNTYFLVKIATGKIKWFIFLFLPFVNIVALIMVLIKLPKAFGKGIGTTLLLAFLSPIGFLCLGFDDSQYLGPQ